MAEDVQFVEAPVFPAKLAYGAHGGPRFSTDVVQQYDGTERRNRNWYNATCVWDVGSGNRSRADILVLLEFYYAVAQGQRYSFRFKDFTDYQFNNSIGTGDGSTQTFQLLKLYAYARWQLTRLIQKPRSGSLTLTVGGIVREDYDIDFATGQVTFWTAPSSGADIRASGEFDTPARFTQDHLPITRTDPNVYTCDRIALMEVRLPITGAL